MKTSAYGWRLDVYPLFDIAINMETGTRIDATSPDGQKIYVYGSTSDAAYEKTMEIIEKLEDQKKGNIQKARGLLKKSDFSVTLQPHDVREMIKLILDELELRKE